MRKYVSHVPHVLPWDLGMIRNNFFGYMGSSFTDDFKIPHYGIKGLSVRPELLVHTILRRQLRPLISIPEDHLTYWNTCCLNGLLELSQGFQCVSAR